MVINMLVEWHADGPNTDVFREKVDRISDYLWYVYVAKENTLLEPHFA